VPRGALLGVLRRRLVRLADQRAAEEADPVRFGSVRHCLVRLADQRAAEKANRTEFGSLRRSLVRQADPTASRGPWGGPNIGWGRRPPPIRPWGGPNVV